MPTKICVACDAELNRPKNEDEPERLAEFCADCLANIRNYFTENKLPDATDETVRLHHNCETCVSLQRREMDRERLGSAAAWAFLWWCIGLASSVWANEWLGLVDCLK